MESKQYWDSFRQITKLVLALGSWLLLLIMYFQKTKKTVKYLRTQYIAFVIFSLIGTIVSKDLLLFYFYENQLIIQKSFNFLNTVFWFFIPQFYASTAFELFIVVLCIEKHDRVIKSDHIGVIISYLIIVLGNFIYFVVHMYLGSWKNALKPTFDAFIIIAGFNFAGFILAVIVLRSCNDHLREIWSPLGISRLPIKKRYIEIRSTSIPVVSSTLFTCVFYLVYTVDEFRSQVLTNSFPDVLLVFLFSQTIFSLVIGKICEFLGNLFACKRKTQTVEPVATMTRIELIEQRKSFGNTVVDYSSTINPSVEINQVRSHIRPPMQKNVFVNDRSRMQVSMFK